MSRIYIYSPAGAVLDKTGFRRGVKRLQQMGHEVELDIDVLSRDTRFAGSDAKRVAAIERAAAASADITMIGRGGYGMTRILHALPYAKIAKSIEQGTKWVGFSDFTALQLALLSKHKKPVTTWAGTALIADFGAQEGVDELTSACFNDLASGIGEGTGWRMDIAQARYHAQNHGQTSSVQAIQQATLWGGNLCVVNALLGTPYFPVIEGGILFLEDVAEHPYRIERMLLQLHQAGVLEKQKAIVLGQFTNYKLGVLDKGYKLQSVVDYLRSLLKIPVITGLPFGHTQTKVCLPVGAQVDLFIDQRDVYLVWG